MTAGEWVATLCRRWSVMLGVLLCTAGVLFAVQGRTITYRGCEQLFLGAPPLPWNKNVLTGENASVAMTTGMVTETVNSEQVRNQIAAAGYPTYYNMLMTNTGESRFPSYTSPTLHICVSSPSKRAVLGTTAAASQKFITLLADMQIARHVPVKSRITVTRLASAAPFAIVGRPQQAYFGVALAGLLAAVALALWTDPVLTRWQQRRQLRVAAAS
jgi:hypothetical protein